MFLKEGSISKLMKEHPNIKLSMEFKTMKALNEDELYSSMKLLENKTSELKKIPNFYDGFHLGFEDFNSFKQGYRNTVGMVFE